MALILLSSVGACSPDIDETLGPADISNEVSPPLQSDEFRQWAIEAEASSEFANPEWAAEQAVGEPNTSRCGDYQTAWATAGSDSLETISLSYAEPVYVRSINIIQSFNPNQVVRVELLGAFDRAITVFESQPIQVDQPCPYTLSIPIQETEGRYSKVRITIDQSILGLGWNQIDAVELVGNTDGSS